MLLKKNKAVIRVHVNAFSMCMKCMGACEFTFHVFKVVHMHVRYHSREHSRAREFSLHVCVCVCVCIYIYIYIYITHHVFRVVHMHVKWHSREHSRACEFAFHTVFRCVIALRCVRKLHVRLTASVVLYFGVSLVCMSLE